MFDLIFAYQFVNPDLGWWGRSYLFFEKEGATKKGGMLK